MSLDIDFKWLDEDASYNITHNLSSMAEAAGLHAVMWMGLVLRGDAIVKVERAADMIPALAAGIATLASDPARFRQEEPANRWGSYEGLLRTAVAVLHRCVMWPDATVTFCR